MSDSDIFGLSKPQVQSILTAACHDTVTDYTVCFGKRDGTEGICGEYLLPTFYVKTEAAGTVEVSMFIRRQLRESVGRRQAHQYGFLAARGVPIPAIYGSLIDDEGREIIFLELIDHVRGSDSELLVQRDYVERYLHLAATLSAVIPTTEYVGQLGHDLVERDFVLN